MKKALKFFAVVFAILICIFISCEKNENTPTTDNASPIIEMAWLNDDGSISSGITSNFLMVHKNGVEKNLLHDNYLVSIIDSANNQDYSISFFDSTNAYVPSRIVSGNLEFVISNFNDATFTFDMNIISPASTYGLKSTNEEKTVYKLYAQKFDVDIEQPLKKLKEYTYGEDNQSGGVQSASYLNTLRVTMNEAFKGKYYETLYENALKQTGLAKEIALEQLNNSKDFARLKNYNWKSQILLGISKSIGENIAKDGDWYGTYGDEVSLALSGGFTIAGCVGTLGVGCTIGVIGFGVDAYKYYQEHFVPTHIGIMEYTFQGSSDGCGCGNTSMTVDFGNGTVKTINNGQRIELALKAGTYNLKLHFTTSSGADRSQTLIVDSDNFTISWYCYCTQSKSTYRTSNIEQKL